MSSTMIAQTLRTALAQPSVRVGQRLLSERKLAERLNVTHNQMRKSLLDLVEEGVLLQKRGSGTFVRRVPDLATVSAQEHEGQSLPTIHPKQILHLHAHATEHNEATRQQTTPSYDIGLWWDNLTIMTPIQQLVLEGMIVRAESLGHRLSVHPMTRTDTHQPFDPQTLRQRVLAHRNDGYLCIGWCESEFSEFLSKQMDRPVVFFNTDGQRLIAQPHVVFDMHHATQLAVHRLQQQGCQNIWDIHLDAHESRKQTQGQYASHRCTYHWLSLDKFDTPSVARLISQWLAKTTEANPGQPVDGIHVADDHLLAGVVEAVRAAGRLPGKDIAIISMANEGLNQPWPVGLWSQMRFNPRQLGRQAVDMLVKSIIDPKAPVPSIALRADWVPGQSHLLTNASTS